MLSRTADSLYWTGRYIERAEHLSRETTERITNLGPAVGTLVGVAEDVLHLLKQVVILPRPGRRLGRLSTPARLDLPR